MYFAKEQLSSLRVNILIQDKECNQYKIMQDNAQKYMDIHESKRLDETKETKYYIYNLLWGLFQFGNISIVTLYINIEYRQMINASSSMVLTAFVI